MINEEPSAKKSSWLPLRTALLWIFFSTFLISGSSFLGFLYYLYLVDQRTSDDKYRIIALVQTCPDKECLKTVYLAELLGLSVDKPTNLYQFNSNEAREKLLACPLIKEASVKKISPGTIYVDYTLRTPMAFLGDYTNTAIDEEGIAFPFKPFFTPKKLPVVFVGVTENSPWGKRIQGKNVELMLSLLRVLAQMSGDLGIHLLRLDTSKAHSPSYGQRQIVVIFEEHKEKIVEGRPQLFTFPTTLRLSTDQISQQLTNYAALRPHLIQQKASLNVSTSNGFIIDLRIPELAFIAVDAL